MLADGFKQCQCAVECVTVGSFVRGESLPVLAAALVSSQSFPHLWKKLWKFNWIRRPTTRFGAFCQLFPPGRSRNSAKNKVFSRSVDGGTRKKAVISTAKPSRQPFFLD
jgi:hypothetical protein